jgi:hypothetical protein
VLSLAALLAASSWQPALGHGGAAIDRDPCAQKTGSWLVHFTVYEPEYNPGGEYCVDVPKAGPVIVVFDLVDQEMRKVAFDLRVERSDGGERQTVLHVPAKAYPSGVINAELSLPAPGRYTAILTPEGQSPVVFPMRVEMATPLWAWLAPLLLLAPLLYYWSQRRSASRTTAAGETRRNLALVK